jgi:hypothetical protein
MLSLATSLIQTVPPHYNADETAMWFFTIWAGGMAIVVLPYVIKRLRAGDSIPLYIWFGGFICSVCEPMLDHLGHLWWPHNLPGPAFSGYDLGVPLLIPPCYVFFIAMTGYWVYTKMDKGLQVKHVFWVFALAAARDMILEYPGLSLDVYKYYGYVPTRIGPFPWFWAWTNGAAMMTVGFVIYLAMPYLKKNPSKRPFALLIPITGFMAAYGIVGTPYFMALHWPFPKGVQWLLAAWSLAMAVLLVRVIAYVVTTRERTVISDLGWGEDGPPPPAPDRKLVELIKL